MSGPVLIMAGGTGGHIFPGIAVGIELRQRGVPVVWLGGRSGLETRLVPEAGFVLESLEFAGVRGKGVWTLLAAPWRLLRAVLVARRVLRRLRPRSVLSMGGYAAAPGGIAAWWARIPLFVHEQNRVPGFTNRLLRRFSRIALEGFQGSLRGATWVGNPVRSEIAGLPVPEQRLTGRHGPIHVLVLGGSQGAQSLNRVLPQVLSHRADQGAWHVRHQCGERHLQATRDLYAAADVKSDVLPFIADMAEAYAWADVVICRAGALTLAELCAVGIGAVLVPFPQAVDDHQTRNAEVLVDAGAARLVPEGDAFAERLGACLDAFESNRALLLDMAVAARTLARPDATARIADICMEVRA
jgi:UDP-N-acetylglucosamine--N-acetylmuramyl-(pentapeptide) pyrophosphoryl-undecaprenol N-acetylglucosamine transferase